MEIVLNTNDGFKFLKAIDEIQSPWCATQESSTTTDTRMLIHIDGVESIHKITLRSDGTWFVSTEITP